MDLPEIIGLIVIALVIGGATLYIVLSKKKGNKCIGCPFAKECQKNKKNCSKK